MTAFWRWIGASRRHTGQLSTRLQHRSSSVYEHLRRERYLSSNTESGSVGELDGHMRERAEAGKLGTIEIRVAALRRNDRKNSA